MLAAFLVSFAVIFVAELGDKSQLMALAFATRYKPATVLIGITVAKRFSGGGGDKPVEATLGLPAGSTILQAMPADGQLAVTARLPDGTTRVTVIDLASGRTLATVRP